MKLTKKQRKALRGPNAAVMASMRNGNEFGGYTGQNPIYHDARAKPTDPPNWVKVKPGVPFVKTSRWA